MRRTLPVFGSARRLLTSTVGGAVVSFFELILLRVSDPELALQLSAAADGPPASLRAAVALLHPDDGGANRDGVEVLTDAHLLAGDEPAEVVLTRNAQVLLRAWTDAEGRPSVTYGPVAARTVTYGVTPKAADGAELEGMEVRLTLDEADVDDPDGYPSLGPPRHLAWAGTVGVAEGLTAFRPADDLVLLVAAERVADVEEVQAIEAGWAAEREEVLNSLPTDGRRARLRAVEQLTGDPGSRRSSDSTD